MPDGISVILPAFRERENLAGLVPALLDGGLVEECVVVEDPSGHEATALMRDLCARYGPRLLYHRNEKRLGLALSLRTGIGLATQSHCLVRDSDWNHDIGLLPEFRACLGLDFVVASRYARGIPAIGRLNDLFSLALNAFLRLRFGTVTDWTYGYFLVRRELALTVPIPEIFRGRGEYTIRLYRALLDLTPTFKELPTVVQSRGHGRSTTAVLRHGWPYLLTLLERRPKAVLAIYGAFARKHGFSPLGAGHSWLGWRARKKLLSRFTPKLGPWLDLGCGNGFVAKTCFPQLSPADGADFSSPALEVASACGYYRQTYRLDVRKELPPGRYRGFLCLELLQYLPREELPAFFRALANHAEPGAALLLLAPHRTGRLHSLRRLVKGRRHPDYRGLHSFGDVAEAMESAGFRITETSGASFFTRRLWSAPGRAEVPPGCFVYGISAVLG